MSSFEGSRDELLDKIKRKQRSLIPLNIFVVIISLVAALSLLFAPVVTIDMSDPSVFVSAFTDDSDGTDDDTGLDYNKVVTSVAKSLGPEVSVTTLGLFEMSFSGDVKQYLTDTVAGALSESSDELIVDVGLPVMMETIKENNPDLEIPDVEEPEVIVDKFKELETATDSASIDNVILGVADEIQNQLGTDVVSDDVRDQIIDAIRDAYDTTVANTGDGSFSLESCICVLASKYLVNGSSSSPTASAPARTGAMPAAASDETGNTEGDQVFTNYEDLVGYLLDSATSGDSEELNRVIDIAVIALQVVSVVMLFFAALWIVLALFALVHIFTKNKAFAMWYVKLFGWLPCLIFGIVPLVAPAILTAVAADVAATIVPILQTLSTLTWISGACYIVLWLTSIFWAFPIKKQIRKYNAQLKYAK